MYINFSERLFVSSNALMFNFGCAKNSYMFFSKYYLNLGGMYAFGSLFPIMAIIPKIINENVASNYSTRPVGFPYHVEYFVDLNKYYYPVLIHNYLATAIRLTAIVSCDTCVAILVQHCCALFSIVRYARIW